MLKFPYTDIVPRVKDTTVEAFCLKVVADFCKAYGQDLLTRPQKIDALKFLEFYSGCEVTFEHIYFKGGDDPILGVISFEDGTKLKVFDKENKCTRTIKLKRGAIVVDKSLEQDGAEGRLLFTYLHEDGHWFLHPEYYTGRTGAEKYACCFRSDIEGYGQKRELVTEKDFIEHQANVFAAAIAVPKPALDLVIADMVNEYGAEKSNGVLEDAYTEDGSFYVLLMRKVAEVFGVSVTTARIRLQKLKYIDQDYTYSN